ncbi:DUF4158 domain-containing protein [Streptomyces sp. NPDC051567]|uniref:DUF4158 domain-containing protein n=1 Tax=Streptomyces sp. NPDC051567 TaxID=3365660 RepID=UPI0037AD45D3
MPCRVQPPAVDRQRPARTVRPARPHRPLRRQGSGRGPLAVPWEVVERLAGQLGTRAPRAWSGTRNDSGRRTSTRWRSRNGSGTGTSPTGDGAGSSAASCVRAGADARPGGPVALFNHTVTRLRESRVLLPGVPVPDRQVPEARTAAERRVYEADPRGAPCRSHARAGAG